VDFLRTPSKLIALEGLHGAAEVARPIPGCVVVTLVGHDAGDLAEKVFSEIEIDLAIQAPLQLFVDAADASPPSMTASHAWARWLCANGRRLGRVVMLASSRLSLVTSHFIHHQSGLGEQMTVTADPFVFERALRSSGTFPKVSATWRIANEVTPPPDE
jgi:hypothetical protein